MKAHSLLPYVVALALPACAGNAGVVVSEKPEPQLLTEAEALQIIQETLAHEGATVAREWPVRVDDATELLVDARVGNNPFAIEWVSDEDRSVHAALLPQSRPDGPLRIITGMSADAPLAQVLVLDAHAYGYEGNPRLVQRGALSITDAEARVRRDVEDFLDYARAQGL
jgi:hypothetical protein